jgi:hypothetical protein
VTKEEFTRASLPLLLMSFLDLKIISYTWEKASSLQTLYTFPLDKLFTFKNGYVYSAEGESVFDVVLAIDGPITVVELFGVLLATEML